MPILFILRHSSIVAIILIDIETDPNHPRVLQSKELIQSLTVGGIGLSLETGFSRDLLGYSMELSYLSILSKFGLITGTFVIIGVISPLAPHI